MSSTVISVRNLSKRYRIGLKEKQHDTLAGKLGALIKAPIDNLKKLKSLSSFNGHEDESVFWALKDVSFDVQQGEVLGIIGHNGAGKSTLLKILSRITEPTSGEIHVKGRIAALLEVGTGFHPELTGRENIYMNGTILGMTRREINIKLDEIVDFSGVEKYLDTPVKFYSSGMKIRLGFSVAAHLEPELLIIDEVLAVGDLEFQRKSLGKMEDVSRSGRTVLFVSHNMASIAKLCQRGIVLEHGKIIYTGTARKAIEEYLHSRPTESLDLKNLPRRYKTDEADFTQARLVNENGNAIDKLLFRQPIRIVATLKVHKQVRAGIDLVIKSFDEVEVMHAGSHLQYASQEFLPGIYSLSMDLENNLVPGQYLMTLGIHHTSAGTTIDYCENFNQFEVVEAGFNESESYPLKTKYGYIASKAKIQIQKIHSHAEQLVRL